MGRGTIYIHLAQLQEDGLVESKLVRSPTTGVDRSLNTLTRRGQRIPIEDAPGDL